jgi:hypothetical protein
VGAPRPVGPGGFYEVLPGTVVRIANLTACLFETRTIGPFGARVREPSLAVYMRVSLRHLIPPGLPVERLIRKPSLAVILHFSPFAALRREPILLSTRRLKETHIGLRRRYAAEVESLRAYPWNGDSALRAEYFSGPKGRGPNRSAPAQPEGGD